jgi:PP-loop superfamily ATP-utilizing enzyme
MCHAYKNNFDLKLLQNELKEFLSRKREPGAEYDALVAFSGGKDSTVSLAVAVERYGLKVLAVLVDNGFIPDEVIAQGKEICNKLGVPLRVERIDFAPKVKELLKNHFATGYPCNVCTVLFHNVLVKVCIEQKVNRVILGRNWWRELDPKVKSIRTMNPDGINWNIELLSLPFALQLKEEEQREYLEKVGWKSQNVYGHSTNCLIPGLVEKIVYDRIGYHPELNLISREVIVGFLTKEAAAKKIASVKDLSLELRTLIKQKTEGQG